MSEAKREILIIGAGFTGLTAAYELSKCGFTVTVAEKNRTIGGLAGGFEIEGSPIEQAYHHLFRTDTDILNLIEELGLTTDLHWFQSKVAMIVNDKNGNKVLPFNGVVDLLNYSPLPFIDRLRAGFVTFFLQKYNNWQSLKNSTALSWMNRWAGRVVTEKIWGMLLKGKFAGFAEQISMAWLWARIHIRANSRKSIFEKEMLAYPKNGFASISTALQKRIEENGSNVVINSQITRINRKDNHYEVEINGQIKNFAAIISTIPTSVLEKLFDQKISSTSAKPIDYLSAVVLAFSSSQSLSKFYWHTITDPNAPFLVFLQHTNLAPASWYRETQVYYLGAYVPQNSLLFQSDQESIEKTWFSYLKKTYPDFDVKQISEKKLFKFSHAQHVVTVDYEDKIPPYELALPNLYQANFAQIYPEDRGTNYAVREGKKIAQMVTENLMYNAST